jgi:hypothetical protein
MTADDFRRLALELPGAIESAHMGHPDFRANKKIFATLNYPNGSWGMIKLPPEQQDNFCKAQPGTFVPVKGAWGRQGSTSALLESADEATVRRALRFAFDGTANAAKRAPKKASKRPTPAP